MLNSWSVAKFGGTSMADEFAIRRSAKVVAGDKSVQLVVVSATSGTTNQLLSLIESTQKESWNEAQDIIEKIRIKHLKICDNMGVSENIKSQIVKLLKELETISRGLFLLKDPTKKAIDQIQSIGERMSSHFMVKALQEDAYDRVEYLDARSIIFTDDNFGKALPDIERTEENAKEYLEAILKDGGVFVTQGFIGRSPDGFTTTLGRGGSDYSAALFAEAISAKELQIWTDVAGVATTDPRLCPEAKPIEELSYKEAAELATFGAKVLHPTTLWPAMRKKIPVFVGSSMESGRSGTWIRESSNDQPTVRAMAIRKNQSLLTLTTPRMLHTHGFLAKVFTVFDKYKLSVDLITTSEISIALTLNDANLLNKSLLKELKEFAEVKVDEDLSLISIIGNRVQETAGLSKTIFSEISDVNVRMICVGASENNVGFLVASAEAESALKKLHKKFLED
ncbi:MAG: lysine-sensitive aspartokinase 3 [Bdellovibrionales bacterium]